MVNPNLYKSIKSIDDKLSTYRKAINSIQTENLSQHGEFEIIEELSSHDKQILVVRGKALTEGKKKQIYYSADELKRAAHRLIGQGVYYNFTNAALTHKPVPGNLVGQITNAFYDEEIKGIRYEASIHNPKIIDKIINKDPTIKGVSVGVGSFTRVVDNIKHGFNLFFKELSFVQSPADKNSSVEW